MFIQRDEKHLFYLENALERIGKKTYGLCISCGKHISKARLEAVPITSHCISCKQNLSH
jgi:DnaK suppressor protein